MILKIVQNNVHIGLYHSMQGIKSVKKHYQVRHVEHTSCWTEESNWLKANAKTDGNYSVQLVSLGTKGVG